MNKQQAKVICYPLKQAEHSLSYHLAVYLTKTSFKNKNFKRLIFCTTLLPLLLKQKIAWCNTEGSHDLHFLKCHML